MLSSLLTIFLLLGVNGVLSDLPRNPLDPLTLADCGKGKFPAGGGDRIVGGDFVRHGQYPWVVSLYKQTEDFKHNCGGSILNENWVITAAHCVSLRKPWMYEVFAGLYKRSQENGPTVKHYQIAEIHIHPNYTDEGYSDDIALIKVAKPIDIAGSGGYINGICLPMSDEDPTGHARAIGWGAVAFDAIGSDTLKQVVIPIIDRPTCMEKYRSYGVNGVSTIRDSMLCAGALGKSPCSGDSGGPLIQTDSNGVSTLYGLTNFSFRCALEDYPMVFAKVSHFRDWMEEIMLH